MEEKEEIYYASFLGLSAVDGGGTAMLETGTVFATMSYVDSTTFKLCRALRSRIAFLLRLLRKHLRQRALIETTKMTSMLKSSKREVRPTMTLPSYSLATSSSTRL